MKGSIFNVNWGSDFIVYQHAEIGGGMCVVSSDYTVLRSEGQPIFESTRISVSELTDFLVSDDTMKYITVEYNENNGFWLIVSVPRQVKLDISLSIDNSSGNITVLFFLSVIIGSILIFLFSIFMYSLITSASLKKPLSQLTATANNIKIGCYEAPVPDSRISELYNVQEAFYLMSEKISEEISNTRLSEKTRKKLMLDISHDLKNPLMSIRGYSELLQKTENNIDTKKINLYLNIILENSMRADKLVNDLFTLAKMENAENINKYEKTDIAELLKTTLIERLEELESSGFKTDFDIPDSEVCISGDSDELVRVFSNIADNALKYRNDDAVFNVKLSTDSKNMTITFSNGSALECDDNVKLTKEFVRAEGSETISPEGAGLGLSIVEKIITLHNGTVSCGYSDGCFEIKLSIPLLIE